MKRYVGRIALVVVLFLGIAAVALKIHLDRHYFDGVKPESVPTVRLGTQETTDNSTKTNFYFRGYRNLEVPALLITPTRQPPPYPCVVFLHGIGDNKDFLPSYGLDKAFTDAGYALATFDQLTCGERKLRGRSWYEQAEAFRVRTAHTVGDTLRLVEYLCTLPEIDKARLYLCGASFGAMSGAIAAAMEPRFRAVVLVYGGADWFKILSAPFIRAEIGAIWPAMLPIAWYFGSVFDPSRYVGEIAPRPILFQNGKADPIITPAAARVFQEAAHEPKKVLWYEGEHLGTTRDLDMALALRVLRDALAFLQEN